MVVAAAVIVVALYVTFWIDIARYPSWAFKEAAETERLVWVVGSLFCGMMLIWWWFSATRRMIRYCITKKDGQTGPAAN